MAWRGAGGAAVAGTWGGCEDLCLCGGAVFTSNCALAGTEIDAGAGEATTRGLLFRGPGWACFAGFEPQHDIKLGRLRDQAGAPGFLACTGRAVRLPRNPATRSMSSRLASPPSVLAAHVARLRSGSAGSNSRNAEFAGAAVRRAPPACARCSRRSVTAYAAVL
eukprot:COSAG02_NODE_5561_length_4228_cov_309.315331_3_plen_164_part_00